MDSVISLSKNLIDLCAMIHIQAFSSRNLQSMRIEAQAVQNGQRGQYVYVVNSDKSVEMRPVSVVQQVDQSVVVNKGVQPGDSVVTDGQLRLTPKSKVEIKGAL